MLFTTLPLRSALMVSSASASLSSASNISTASKSFTGISFGQCERKHGASIDFTFGPYPPAVPGDHTMNDGQAHAGAPELVCAMQALEHSKKLVRILHVETDAVVANGVVSLRADVAAADLDDGTRRLAAVLERIGDEIRPHLAQQPAVAAGG